MLLTGRADPARPPARPARLLQNGKAKCITKCATVRCKAGTKCVTDKVGCPALHVEGGPLAWHCCTLPALCKLVVCALHTVMWRLWVLTSALC